MMNMYLLKIIIIIIYKNFRVLLIYIYNNKNANILCEY